MNGGVLLDRYSGRPVVDRDVRRLLSARGRDDVVEHIERSRLLPALVAAERTPPLYMDVSSAYSGDELGLPWRDVISEGIVGSTDLAVTAQAGANSVNVAKGSCWVLGDTNADLQPNYRCFNDAIVNLGISPDPTNPRNVLIVAQVIDQGFAGTGRTWQLQALHGAPGAGTPPGVALPASALSLAAVLVPAAAASSAAYTITDLRSRARLGGNIDRVITSPLATGPPPNPREGDVWVATGVTSGSAPRWTFMYDTSEATYKWKFVGGPPVVIGGGSGTPSPINTYVNVITSGFTLLRGGTYVLQAHGQILTGAGAAAAYTGAIYGNTPANVLLTGTVHIPASSNGQWGLPASEFTVAAGVVLGISGASGQLGATFSNHAISIFPVRII